MKRMILAVFILFISGQVSYAHPPSDIEAVYDPEAKSLNITIYHNVKNTEKHFIQNASVKLNEKDIIVREFESQADNAAQKFGVPVENNGLGDTVTVDSSCSMGGDLEKVITINR